MSSAEVTALLNGLNAILFLCCSNEATTCVLPREVLSNLGIFAKHILIVLNTQRIFSEYGYIIETL